MANTTHNSTHLGAANDNNQLTHEVNHRRAMYERIARGHTIEAAEADARRKLRNQ